MAAKPSKAKPSDLPAYIALFRGVNVGGKNMLPMTALVEIFTGAGCVDVRTYIQSGNVVYRAKPSVAKGVGKAVGAAILKRFGFEARIVTRTGEEMARAVDGNPFLKGKVDLKALHVGFLGEEPAAARAASLDPKRSPGDSFLIVGREVYLHLPKGMADSKLTNAWFDSALGTVSTFRNWNTVRKLVEMSRGGE